jgi:hypothetical protein
MAATLHEMLLAPEIHTQIVSDCESLIDNQVSGMSGISGTAVKLAYKAMRTFTANHIYHTIEDLLPRMTDVLQPYWADFNAAGGGEFGDYLARREDEVAEALLSITDERGRNSKRPAIAKTYNAVRGGAAKHVKAALPAVGTLVQKYA